MKNVKLNLSPRLKKIYDITPKCGCFADIGTDHAYLPTYMCLTEKCTCAIASDIVEGPLRRAEATVLKYHTEDKISLRLGPGVSTLSENEADVVSIAGMGGLIIAQILEDGKEIFKSAEKIILQPMTAVSDLRRYLLENNIYIDEEYLVKDNGKLYNILTVSNKKDFNPYEDVDVYIGKRLIENKPELYSEYLSLQISKLEKKVNGLKKSHLGKETVKITELQNLLDKTKLLTEG